jgi:hypothetical protein
MCAEMVDVMPAASFCRPAIKNEAISEQTQESARGSAQVVLDLHVSLTASRGEVGFDLVFVISDGVPADSPATLNPCGSRQQDFRVAGQSGFGLQGCND